MRSTPPFIRAWFRSVRAIARNEIAFVLREPRMLLVALAQPMILLMLYGYCISFDLSNIPFAVLDQDRTAASRALVSSLDTAGPKRPLRLRQHLASMRDVEPVLGSGQVRFVLVVPRGFAEEVEAARGTTVQALFDAADSNTAGVAAGYLEGAIRYASGAARIALHWRVWYNPDLSSRRFIIPGLLGVLLTFVAGSLTATTLVRERELGSFESLLTSPVSAGELVAGKLAPYILVAAGNVVLVLLVGGLVFGVWPRGNLPLLALYSFLFVVGNLAIGMRISASAPSQHYALVLAVLVNMLPNFFLTGFAFPRSNMPLVLQWLSFPMPATQYLIAVRGIFLKGAGWSVLWPQGLWMALTAAVLVAAAVRTLRQRMERGLE